MNESNFYNENIDLTGHPIIDDENFEKFIGEKKFQEFTSLAISINKKGFGIRENSAFGMNKESLPFFKEILIPKYKTGIDKKAKIFHISNTYHDSGHDIIGVVNLNEIT